MKTKCILIITILFTSFINAQKVKLSDMYGLWVYGLRESSFIVFVKDEMVGVDFFNFPDVYINYTKVGFIDRNNPVLIDYYKKKNKLKVIDSDTIRMTNMDIPENLKIEILDRQKNEYDYFFYGGTLCGLGIDPEDLPSKVGSRFELINSNVFVYIKVAGLPNNYITALYKKGIKDKKNYLKNFFNMDFKEIKIAKSIIYKTPNNPTKMYLLKGNEVEVLEQKDNWLRIRYYGNKTIEGWIKKEDVAVE